MASKRVVRKLSLCMILLLCLSGCWDSSDIEDISFAMGFGIDASDDEQEPIQLTTQVALTKKQGEQATAQQGKLFQNVTLKANSIHEMVRGLSLQLPYPILTDHLETVVINQDIVTDYDLFILLDELLRDNITRLSPSVVISAQQASDILATNIDGEITSDYISAFFTNETSTMKILPKVRVGDVTANLISGTSVILPKITKDKKTVKLDGAGIIRAKDNKLTGFLTDKEVEGVNWLTGEGAGGLLNFRDEKGNTIIYEIQHYKTKSNPHYKNGKLTFDVQITAQGWITEDWSLTSNNLSEKYVDKLERLAAEEVVKIVEGTMKKLQQDYKTDVVKFYDSFRIAYPRDYQKMQKDWDNYFADADVKYDVKIKIVNTGDLVKEGKPK
ncbi:spore germination protein AC/spore germination protein [Terribacillus aidingensis]|uniref:Spore germination protein AC/spore germination protein n=1 Tax=Terribacillus aidingensis TaxID=586416 RepID=A0A285NK04_9BACI|nr:Ger(x)C family spore germination protein [Terribacillus aidingensis]SNZ09820.1 spore germination protein AC/spore germination protein [Terribacillus aidingensis]